MLGDAGFRPLKAVQGVSVLGPDYRRKISHSAVDTGQGSPSRRGSAAINQLVNTGGWFDIEERTEACNFARTTALRDLEISGRKAGACAVVDVRVRHGRFDRARNAREFTAIGTAVASDRYEPEDNEPVPIVSVSGSDFWKLLAAGFWPLGLVGGTSVVYVWSSRRTRSARFRLSYRSFVNQEYLDYTEGLSHARFGASGRMRREAEKLGASGLIGVSVTRELKRRREDDLIVTVDMLGTAVAPLESGAPPSITYAVGLGRS
jgi:uncharacterized protein YbjQ (UPF0145 family)